MENKFNVGEEVFFTKNNNLKVGTVKKVINKGTHFDYDVLDGVLLRTLCEGCLSKDIFAKGNKVSDLSYLAILEVLKDKIEEVVDDTPYENDYSFTGSEIEHKASSGFIPFTDGGFEAVWFEYIDSLVGSGKRLPTKPLQEELERQSDYNYKNAKENFIEKHPDIVEELGEENIDYNTLYEKGYGDEAEELSNLEHENAGEDSVMMAIKAYYYNPENSKGENGKHTISLQSDVNLESPYHHPGNMDDGTEVTFTFNSIDELKDKMDAGLKTIMDWFSGSDYNTSKAEMKIRRMKHGGDITYAKGGKLPEKGTPEWHQIQIAKKTVNMNPAMAGIMGGMSISEAKSILNKYGIKYAKGGPIKNQYKGRTFDNVWNSWTIEQREHFLFDHEQQIKEAHEQDNKNTTLKIYEFKSTIYSDLPNAIKNILYFHTSSGQYSKGGLLVGESHANGGIKVIAPNGQIEVEGGEVIINRAAAENNCELLSKINQSAGDGVAIPCAAKGIMVEGFEKGDRVFDTKKNLEATITKVAKPTKGSALENEPFLIDIKYDDGTKSINMPIGERFKAINTNIDTWGTQDDIDALYELFPDSHTEAQEIWNKLNQVQKDAFINELTVTDAASEHIAESWLEFINAKSEEDWLENATNWDEMAKGGGVGKYLGTAYKKAKEATKKGFQKSKEFTKTTYDKSKASVDKTIRDKKRDIAFDVLQETRAITDNKKESMLLNEASNLVEEMYAKGTKVPKCPIGTEVGTIIFDKNKFNLSESKNWLKRNEYLTGVDKKIKTFHFRQKNPSKFRKGSLRTIKFDDGIKAVIGCPKKAKKGSMVKLK